MIDGYILAIITIGIIAYIYWDNNNNKPRH